MRRIVVIAATLGASLPHYAQERLTIPLSDANRPSTIRVNLLQGSVTVTGGATKDVVVEYKGRERDRSSNVPSGMKRVYSGGSGLSVTEENNIVRIDGEGWDRPQDLSIQVPQRTSLVIKTVNSGQLRVENVEGEIEASNVNGSIEIRGVSGSVVANTVNGKMIVVFDRVAPDKPMSLTTLNGVVDVTLPADTKATLRLKTDHGDVFTDFELPIKTETQRQEEKRRDGSRRWKSESVAVAALNGGGPEIRMETMNGKIYIRKK